jgi:hypothetical protein
MEKCPRKVEIHEELDCYTKREIDDLEEKSLEQALSPR